MSDFFWTSGHLGWGLFAAIVFSGLWLLLSDLVWRLTAIRIVRLSVAASATWLIGIALIVAGFHLAAP